MAGWEYHPEEFGFSADADLILKKPFEMEELGRTLEKLLSEIATKKVRSKAAPKHKRQLHLFDPIHSGLTAAHRPTNILTQNAC